MSAFETVSALWRLWMSLFDGIHLPWGQSATAAFGMVAAFYCLGLFIKHVIAKRDA